MDARDDPVTCRPPRTEIEVGADHLLTVPEVAAETRFTAAYVYEAVRRQELAAVRKGKYVRIRRGDLASWLEGRQPRKLDPAQAPLDTSSHEPRPTGRGRRTRSPTTPAPPIALRAGAPAGPPGGPAE